MNKKKLLLLNGSPRKKGTSFSFALSLKLLCEQSGHIAEIVHVYDYFDEKQDLSELYKRLNQSDVIGLLAPLYVDTLPYPDIWLLEKLSVSNMLEGKGFFAIGQCGFPDITRCEPLLSACKFFAQESKMKWLGGLGYGGGAIINGTHLEDLGKKGQKMILAFKMALEDILENKQIAPKCQEALTLKFPKILYRPMALFLNHRSKKEAIKNGTKDIRIKAYCFLSNPK